MVLRVAGLLVAFAVFPATAQEFEAASVKLHTPNVPIGAQEASGIDEGRGTIRITNLPLKVVIENAYGVRDYQFSGPEWLSGVRYDIEGKTPAGYTHQQLGPMLRALLAERFKLAVHHESKQVAGYALVAAKGGSKLRESEGPRTYFTARPGLISGTQVKVRELVGALAGRLGRPVEDRTELRGAYDVKLEWNSDEARGGGDDVLPSLFTALGEQLGLRLEAEKTTVDVVVVDRIEKTPIGN